MVLSQEDIISYRNLLFLWSCPQGACARKRRYYLIQETIKNMSAANISAPSRHITITGTFQCGAGARASADIISDRKLYILLVFMSKALARAQAQIVHIISSSWQKQTNSDDYSSNYSQSYIPMMCYRWCIIICTWSRIQKLLLFEIICTHKIFVMTETN